MNLIRSALNIIASLMRELGDENAYRRFLAARGASPSREEWRLFTDQRHGARFKRAKCC